MFKKMGPGVLVAAAFIGLVLVMSMSFIIIAIIVNPEIGHIARGLFIPSIPKDGILTVIALVGTTVVPYNLFLHAALVSEKWNSESDLPLAKRDTMVSMLLGGVVSMAILVSAAAIPSANIETVMDLAKGLEPLYGNAAKYCMGIGLFAAGITSAITAPLAAAYVANSCFGWKARLNIVGILMVALALLLGVKSIFKVFGLF